ncbi:family 43 glycosylhydrolase [Sphingomonas sp. 22176]|uniref:family 43 glycosylhydrolase n=1 Tax=Sphingomonas sp. 22176 TaxID=3453884 RepID=UPI003F87CD3B
MTTSTICRTNIRNSLTYAASATDARYCLGMLTARADADLMDATSRSKSSVPVFHTRAAHKIFRPGHNSFTADERGRDVLVYHARDYAEIQGDPLFDPTGTPARSLSATALTARPIAARRSPTARCLGLKRSASLALALLAAGWSRSQRTAACGAGGGGRGRRGA